MEIHKLQQLLSEMSSSIVSSITIALVFGTMCTFIINLQNHSQQSYVMKQSLP